MLFKDLQLIEPLLKAIEKEGYTQPTDIQRQSIPHLLEGKDLLGIAQTGTGKTAAFTLPLLQLIHNSARPALRNEPRVLVLAPTRELAAQIGQSFEAYGRFIRFRHTVIFGGVGQGAQVQALSKGVDVLVATPGRLLDLMNQKHISLSNVEFFVLDEADRMLDMGFIHDVKKIISYLPAKRQTLFFSATMPSQVSHLASSILRNPVRIEVTPQATTAEKIDQKVFFVDHKNKQQLLLDILKEKHLKAVLIFTRTKHHANNLSEFLKKNNIRAEAIHGNKSQSHRVRVLNDFKSRSLRVLVATDIAARGIDIDNISHVINYELPNEPESYVHRIGRTARAGASGIAYSFCAADERNYLRDIEKLIRIRLPIANHQYHSERAQNATGDNARPVARQQFHRQGPPKNTFKRRR